jgi:hypothetical protein
MENRKRMLHCIICLLPKPNRDCLEVLLNFLREVARYSSCQDGNKMDINNLATVIAPNILYAKSQSNRAQDRISAKDESMLAISAIKCLMDHQERFWTVRLILICIALISCTGAGGYCRCADIGVTARSEHDRLIDQGRAEAVRDDFKHEEIPLFSRHLHARRRRARITIGNHSSPSTLMRSSFSI